MKPIVALAAAALVIPALGALGTRAVHADDIVIGTGGTTGVYFQLGRAICRLVNQHAGDVSCQARSTAGSQFNLSNVNAGALELGVAQSDLQFHAVNGTGSFQFQDVSYAHLRALFSVHGEPFTVVARRDAHIRALDDLRGRRVNIGNPGSGQRATMEVVMTAKGWARRDFQLAEELPADQQSLALCHGRVHAMVYTVGHPNASVEKAVELCDAVIVEVSGPVIDGLVEDNPYYAYTTIPGGTYPGNPDDVKTFGVMATVVSSADVPADTVYAVIKAVFDNFDQFRKMHPAFANLEPERMIREGLSAPMHEGALRYYRERGLM